MPRTKRRADQHVDEATKQWHLGMSELWGQALFRPLLSRARVVREAGNLCPKDGWVVVTADGQIHAHPTRRAEPAEWAYAVAHGLLHLGFCHFARGRDKRSREWTAACCGVVSRFLADLKFGRAPVGLAFVADGPSRSEDVLYQQFCELGVPNQASLCVPSGLRCDPDERRGTYRGWGQPPDWEALFGQGLAEAVESAVVTASGREIVSDGRGRVNTPAGRARAWFVSSYPLLGALAAHFEVVEDSKVCERLDVAIAAVAEAAGEIYVNPAAHLNDEECRFVLAHELLHVGLRHADRRRGRDAYLWNVAADFIINGWLVEMGVGDLPTDGTLYDPLLKGESAETIYDRLVTDLRRARKLQTLRGRGLGDMLERDAPDRGCLEEGVTLDDFCRRALAQGLFCHGQQGRGLLPEGLIEEIRALAQPAIPWDVELARWFAHHFPPIEKVRSYARPSRRQSATPDIPRPSWVTPPASEMGRTFGVVLDTSGSMDRLLLAKALGAIASYSLAREVPAARVVFCDAAAYDEGYVPPEAIADRVHVKGRGGTRLQPGIDLLERAEDFPKAGPILVITDGWCEDTLQIGRDHAFLLPEGHALPFRPRGPVFRVTR